MASDAQQQRCQRIGCNATFDPNNNADDSCRYHPGPPLFHDGGKEWKCCKQRSHDFSLFLDIPGCTTGKHTTEKPQISFTSAKPAPAAEKLVSSGDGLSCSRCRQGFFCSDHGAQPTGNLMSKPQKIELKEKPKNIHNIEEPRILDLNAEQKCKNCKQIFTEKENHDAACNYHPGPAVFHDRLRGWSCCNVHVKEFEEFLTIPPCTKGWHKGSSEA